jgi:hypothetical protein
MGNENAGDAERKKVIASKYGGKPHDSKKHWNHSWKT